MLRLALFFAAWPRQAGALKRLHASAPPAKIVDILTGDPAAGAAIVSSHLQEDNRASPGFHGSFAREQPAFEGRSAAPVGPGPLLPELPIGGDRLVDGLQAFEKGSLQADAWNVGLMPRLGSTRPRRALIEVGDKSFSTSEAHGSQKPKDDGKEKGSAKKDEEEGDLGVSLDALVPIFYFAAPFFAIAFLAFELVHRRWAEVDFEEKPQLPPPETTELKGLFRGIWALARPYWCEDKRGKGKYFVAALLVLNLVSLGFAFVYNLWQEQFWNTFEMKDMTAFMRLMRIYALIVGTSMLVNTYASYLQSMLRIDWRAFMTHRLLETWLHAQAYYRMQLDQDERKNAEEKGVRVDNPDQRIQEDVQGFVASALGLCFGFIYSWGRFCVFLPVLITLSPEYAFGVVYCPGWLAVLALVYSLVGSVASHVIGQELIRLNFAMQRYEADFRYHIVQIRDSAEAIALYRAEPVENQILHRRFHSIKRLVYELMMYQKRLGFFTQFYSETGWMLPFCVLAPNYFRGEITLGHLFQISSALGQVRGAFDWFIDTYPALADFRATADRLLSFRAGVEAASKDAELNTGFGELDAEAGEPSEVRGASVYLPDGTAVWYEAGLKATPGEAVLLSAPEGTGKSIFFRACAGIWPYVRDGKAHFHGAPDQPPFFVPQRSYIPQGPLRQAVAYPHDPDDYGDGAIAEALRAVRLEKSVPVHDLGAEQNWQLVLSGGEQQRLAFARVLLAKPRLVFLDESTSAVGEAATVELYAALRKGLPEDAAVVSISHQTKVMTPLHDSRFNAEPIEVPGADGKKHKAHRWVRA